MDSVPGDETLFISWLTCKHGNVTRCEALMENWLVAVDRVGRHAGG